MMTDKYLIKILKRLILSLIFLSIIIIIKLLFFIYYFAPYEVANYILKYEEIVEYSALLSLIMFVIIVAYIASLIMVWKLKALGRNLLLVTIIFSIIISFGYKYTFMDSLEEILFSVSLIIEGAILALIYLSPISKKFK